MRRFVFAIILAFGLVLIGAGAASAEPTPAAGAAKVVPGKKVCQIEDSKLDELSGLVATAGGFITVDDSSTIPSHKRIFFLNKSCQITRSVPYSGQGPRDTEALAVSPDGKTLYVGDIGDNNRTRSNIAIWKTAINSTKAPTLYRMTYPQGDGPYDAEGLMINGDGTPIVVTKEPGRISFFAPTAPLKEGPAGVPMKRVGDLKPPASTTENPFGPLGRIVATDAAVSPDGSRMVIRTYADAFEFPVTNHDLIAAIKGTPVQTPLPNEPGGESIAYSPDGKSFFTVSDMQGKADGNSILQYTPTVAVTAARAPAAGGVAAGSAKGSSFFSNLSLDDITYLVGAVGLIGAILVTAGVIGIVRARRRPLGPEERDGDDGGPEPETELLAVGGSPSSGPVYGRQQQAAGTYGRPSSGAAPVGGAGVYGRPGPGGAAAAPNGRPAPGARPAPGGAVRPASGGGRPASEGVAPRPVSSGGAGPRQGGPRPPAGGGGPRPPAGGGPRPAAEGGPRPPAGGGPRPASDGGPRPAAGGGPRPAAGGGPRPPAGGGPRPPAGGGPRPPAGGGSRPAAGGGGPRPAAGGGGAGPAVGGGAGPAAGGGPRPAAGGGGSARPVAGGDGGPRPAPGDRPASGGQPNRGGGVYGAPPSPPPSSGRVGGGGPSQRPSGTYGQSGADGRQSRADGYADSYRRGRDIDNPDYGRTPYGR